MALPEFEKRYNEIQKLKQEISKIIESGSNSNGYYMKYSDGTMIQYGGVGITVDTPRSQGGLTYYSGAAIIDFPQSFIDNNYQTFTNILMANMNYFAQSYAANISASQTTISFVSTGRDETRTIHWFAIGRWK